jgi:hypothetical protein
MSSQDSMITTTMRLVNRVIKYPLLGAGYGLTKMYAQEWYTDFAHNRCPFILSGFPSKLYIHENKHKIVAIINMCDEFDYNIDGIHVHKFSEIDGFEPSINTYRKALAVIDCYKNELSPNRKILIHCKAGQQRSASIVLLWLFKTYHNMFTLRDCFDMIHSERPQIPEMIMNRPNMKYFVALIKENKYDEHYENNNNTCAIKMV